MLTHAASRPGPYGPWPAEIRNWLYPCSPPQAGIRHLSFGIWHSALQVRAPLWVAAKRAVALCRSRSPDFVRTLTKSSPSLDFVRVLTTFWPLRGRARRLPFWHSDLRQFCPLKNPSKTEQKRNKTEQNGHQNRKNRSKTSAFCLTYLNIRGPKRHSRPRNGVPHQKKRAFGCFGNLKIDVSLIEQAACKAPRRCS